MSASPLDSALYGDLFGDAEIARLFTDTAEIRAMLLVEGALARAQRDLGLIPADSAAFLHRASLELQIDPAGLAAETGLNANPVPAPSPPPASRWGGRRIRNGCTGAQPARRSSTPR